MTLARRIADKLHQARLKHARQWGEKAPRIKAKIQRRLERSAERGETTAAIPAKLYGEYGVQVRRWLTSEGFGVLLGMDGRSGSSDGLHVMIPR